MKKLLFPLVAFSVVVLVAGCSSGTDDKNSTENQKQSSEQQSKAVQGEKDRSDLSTGIDTVLTSVKALKTTVENTPNDVKAINNKGEALDSNWDVIEKQVEKSDPEAYEDIEKSLYPLFAEAAKDKPDVNKLKQLIDASIEKLNKFKGNLAIGKP